MCLGRIHHVIFSLQTWLIFNQLAHGFPIPHHRFPSILTTVLNQKATSISAEEAELICRHYMVNFLMVRAEPGADEWYFQGPWVPIPADQPRTMMVMEEQCKPVGQSHFTLLGYGGDFIWDTNDLPDLVKVLFRFKWWNLVALFVWKDGSLRRKRERFSYRLRRM